MNRFTRNRVILNIAGHRKVYEPAENQTLLDQIDDETLIPPNDVSNQSNQDETADYNMSTDYEITIALRRMFLNGKKITFLCIIFLFENILWKN